MVKNNGLVLLNSKAQMLMTLCC